ncbi:hypothetical protein [Mycobacterium palustre]|uniref:hypothetical protein n=1 Tax=Mycobacterium palustre TaxID=153971 RepID=UPI001B80BF1E|nr:hypothetical protein [Mycobacterium palustre]
MTHERPVGVHLVGSFPFDDASGVLELVADTVGDRLHRVPDGETEDRRYYYNWHIGIIYYRARDQLQWVSPAPDRYPQLPWFKRRRDADLSTVDFGTFGYAQWAKDSYARFVKLRDGRRFPEHVKFQVNMISPVVPLIGLFDEAIRADIEPAYERALLADLAEILEAIPNDDLAVQWEHVYDVSFWERHQEPFWADDVEEGVLKRIERYSALIPDEVDIGYHLCYGDYQHRHFMEPTDARVLTEMANAITARVGRPIQFFHLPVPRARHDDSYFEPLQDLQLGPQTELYLGLVHYTDGVDGTRRRIETAFRHVDSFGVATECGFGRRPPEQIPGLLRIHRDVTRPVG